MTFSLASFVRFAASSSSMKLAFIQLLWSLLMLVLNVSVWLPVLLTKCASPIPVRMVNRKEETQTHHLSNLVQCYSFSFSTHQLTLTHIQSQKYAAALFCSHFTTANAIYRVPCHFLPRLIKYPDKCIFTTKHNRFSLFMVLLLLWRCKNDEIQFLTRFGRCE